MSVKIWCCVDHYTPRYSGFEDFDNDHDFLDYLMIHYPNDFPRIVSSLYQDGVFPEMNGVDACVNFIRIDFEWGHWDHFQRRYSYVDDELLF